MIWIANVMCSLMKMTNMNHSKHNGEICALASFMCVLGFVSKNTHFKAKGNYSQ